MLPMLSLPGRTRLVGRALIVALGLVGWVAANDAAAAEESPPIIESPRARVALADYEAEVARLPPRARAEFAANRGRLAQLFDNLYLTRAVANDARAANLDRDPVLARQIERAIDKLLAQARFEKLSRDAEAAFDANPEKYLSRAREIYIAKQERFRVPDRVRVSHILVKVGAAGEEGAQARAEQLRARVVAGAAFADLAREASDDPSVKRNGGDLGFVEASKLDPAFAAAAFALRAPGELSPIVKSAFGYHVIQFHERRPAAQRTFDEAKKEIMAEVREEVVKSARTAYEASILTDPVPKVNEDLITKINNEARAATSTADTPTKARR